MSRPYRPTRRQRCRVAGCRKETRRIVAVDGLTVRICSAHPGPITRAMLKPVAKPVEADHG